jgi:hypothetical protein
MSIKMNFKPSNHPQATNAIGENHLYARDSIHVVKSSHIAQNISDHRSQNRGKVFLILRKQEVQWLCTYATKGC